jgi:hypothetical protein
MNASWRRVTIGLAALAVLATAARAQQPPPHVGYAYPAGGRQGTTIEVAIGGQRLLAARGVYVSGGGVQAAVQDYSRPLTPMQAGELREKLQELLKKDRDAAVREQIMAIRKQLLMSANRNVNPAIAETVVARITIAADAEPGTRELRVAAATGLSNPLVFHVGQLPEFSKQEVKNEQEPRRFQPQGAVPRSETTVTLPAVINGRILPGGVDCFHFQARKGQPLVIAAHARELMPYLADAVPGWFQATLTLRDAEGKELAYSDGYRFHPDPLLFFEVPRDGRYSIEIKDALYRGREDFVYRITAGELPLATSIFPLGGPAGTQTAVKMQGWNLPSSTLTVDVRGNGPGIVFLSARKEGYLSNRLPFALDTLPECLEQEPNDQPATAQRVTLPVIVNGRIDPPGDVDVFRFEGRAGQKIVAEVYARRLDSPLDSVLRLTDSAGRQLAMNDDYEDKGAGLITHHADSLLTATLPADGTYYLRLADVQQHGGPEYGYRLRISGPRPDFDLRVVPSGISARAGTSVPLTIIALRRDGFSGEISVALKDAPQGFSLGGAQVPAGRDEVRATLTVPRSPSDRPVVLRLEGRATIEGREVRRPAVPADDMMQAFAYHHLVPAQELMVAIIERGGAAAPLKLLEPGPVKLPAGGTASVRFSAPNAPVLRQAKLELNEPPDGISIRDVSFSQEGLTLLLGADAKVTPGLKGNLIINAFVERVPPAAKGQPPNQKRRVLLRTLPAVPFEIVGVR